MAEKILVTGATGYVGGRLIPRLLATGYRVRAMGRSIEKIASRPWAKDLRVELVAGDVLDLPSLVHAAEGCSAVFYLVHSMVAKAHRYVDSDRQGAKNMAAAAATTGAARIIYLSGLGDSQHPKLSPHLKSRHEVGNILQAGPVPTTVLRAAMILGVGSASFEILRYLVERLPIMLTPRWVFTPTQPIAITNVLDYLIGVLANPQTAGLTLDIGGPDVLTYADLIQLFCEEAGLSKRVIIPVPVLTPRLSAKWIHLVTPVPAAIAQPLTEGLSIPTTCQDNRIQTLVPVSLIDCRQSIRKALQRVEQEKIDTCWMDAGALHPPEWAYCGDADYAGGTILSCGYRVELGASPEEVWKPITKIGGSTGWYYGNMLWRLRGTMDRLVGGVGLRRGRRHPSALQVGDALDFWRVIEVTPPYRLLLLAEMKLPGQALLDIQIVNRGRRRTELRLMSRFLPKGLSGLAYWYVLYPFHQWIFSGMLKAIARTLDRPYLSGPEPFAHSD